MPTGTQLGVLVAFGVIQMAIPYALFARGLRAVGAPEAGLIALAEPILNPLWVGLAQGERPAPATMWMKNTYLSLDMVFIRSDGSIARIAADTEPLSTKVISSGEPVLAVLELNAGTAAKLGLRAGDRVEHPMFKR